MPYPYAKDSEGRFYLLLEDVVLEKLPEKVEPYRFLAFEEGLGHAAVRSVLNASERRLFLEASLAWCSGFFYGVFCAI